MRDSFMENRLNRQSLPWRYVADVPLAKIDIKGSLRNQARLEPLDLELVDNYTREMVAGTAFPAVVTVERARGYYLLDGNHRVNAAVQAGRPTIDMYIIDTQDEYIQTLLLCSLNLVTGRRLSQSEIMAHARSLVERYKRSLKEVAFEMRVSESSLSNALREWRGRDRIKALGVDARNIQSGAAIQVLEGIALDRPFSLAVDLVNRSRLPTGAVQDMAKEVRAQSSEDGMIAVLADWESRLSDRIASTSKGSPLKSNPFGPRDRFLANISRLSKSVEQADELGALGVTSQEDLRLVEEKCEKLWRKLWRLIEEAKRKAGAASARATG